jgi:hypothetical protein
VPDNSVVTLRDHRGQIDMGFGERGLVDPTGRFKHDGSYANRPDWPSSECSFNMYSFVCAVKTTDGTAELYLRNLSIGQYGGASLNASWVLRDRQGGDLGVWFNDTYTKDNAGQFLQEVDITPIPAFMKKYKIELFGNDYEEVGQHAPHR